jgi:HEAT repeat protein
MRSSVDRAEEAARVPQATYHGDHLPTLLVDCLFEVQYRAIEYGLHDRAWQLIGDALDRTQRRARTKEWALLTDWSLTYRALRAVELHESDHVAGRLLETLVEQRQQTGVVGASSLTTDDRAVVLGAINSINSIVRWAATWVFGSMKHEERSEVVRAIESAITQDGATHVRSISVRALAQIRGLEAMPTLISALEGSDRHTVGAAAIGLCRLNTDEAIAAVKRRARQMLEADDMDDQQSAVLSAVIGALETTVSDQTADAELEDVFARGLHQARPQIQASSSSALGKMRHPSAWEELSTLAERKDREGQSQIVRGSAAYACDQLALVLEGSQYAEAARLFRSLVNDLTEPCEIRRPAASGIVKLIGRGYRDARLTNDLLRLARDQDLLVSRSALISLALLDPQDILDDYLLLVNGRSSKERQALCGAFRGRPSRTAFMVANWLLMNDVDGRVLASAADALAFMLKHAREYKRVRVPDGFQVVTMAQLIRPGELERIAERCLATSELPGIPERASSLVMFDELARQRNFRKGGSNERIRSRLLARVRTLLEDESETVQVTACYGIAAFCESDDVARFGQLADQSSHKSVRDAATRARDYLARSRSW